MAANNYFGFTHGGTQYGAQPATAYAQQPAQPTYVQQAQPTAYATAAPQRAQTYETAYQAAAAPAAATQYTYTARTQVAAPTYDPSKAYYTPAAAAPAAQAAPAVYSVAETTYQPGAYQTPTAVPVVAAKPAYTTPVYTAPQAIRQNTVIKPQPATAQTNTYSAYNSSTTSSGTPSSYDAALYSAATSYISQQSKGNVNSWQKKPTFQKTSFAKSYAKPKPQPKQAQLHYCEVCKISCAGPMTYREHLDGQKHKKKEAALKSGTVTHKGALTNQLRCELCDITCTGSDAYAAHIRGAKHQKVLKLHTKLGKPIPSTQPTVVTSNNSSSSSAGSAASNMKTSTAVVGKPNVKATATTDSRAIVKKIIAQPKINFVGAGTLKSTHVKEEPKSEPKSLMAKVDDKNLDDTEDTTLLPGEKEVTPVGHEYIEEVKNEYGKVVSFHCKLCECKFNDPNAKLMHMKGRRHRLQYKKKVDPSLLVEVKPSIRQRKVNEEKLRRISAKEEYWRRRDAEERWREEMRYMMMYENPAYGYGYGRGMPVRRPESIDDRHVMAKHTSIYPNEGELLAVQNIVSSVEKALKLVSDTIAEEDAPVVTKEEKEAEQPKEIKKENKKEPVTPVKDAKKDEKETKPETEETQDKEEEKKEDEAAEGEEEQEEEEEEEVPPPAPRVLKGVMRVGVLAKGLLLHGDLNVHLVVLCAEKPTRTLLERIASLLPKELATMTEDKYEVKICVEEAAAIVTAEKEPKTTCAITLTSPVMRDENLADGEQATETKPDPPDVLDRQKCLDALAALRHAKWFQARANGLQSCVVVIRIMRDLCQRVETWTPLNQWAMELLVEKCVSSGGSNMTPGDALRRVFECISSGILLPGGPGLYDPCEKDPTDASIGLSNQEREDMTASAQHALRMIALRQIHKVLGMDALPKFQGKRFSTRKRKATTGSESGDGEDGKKDKKEEEEKK